MAQVPEARPSAHRAFGRTKARFAKTEELRFLAVSTKLSPEIAKCPNRNRFGALASLAPDETERPRPMMYVGKEGDSCVVHAPFKKAAIKHALDSWPPEYGRLTAEQKNGGWRYYKNVPA